jgi:hypothetical protein
MKVAFSTWCTDDYIDKVGLEGLKNSLQHFHPGVPHFIYGSKETEGIKEKYPWMLPVYMMAPTCMDLAEEYDLVVHIDADSTVTGPLDELWESKEEILGVRNNNTLAQAGKGPAWSMKKHFYSLDKMFPSDDFYPALDFLNAGFVASRNPDFWKTWHFLNQKFGAAFGGGEQDILNIMFHSGNYSTRILDKVGTGVSYGVSNAWGERTHWDGWEKLYVRKGKLYQDDPLIGTPVEIKILHAAGGAARPSPMRPWMDSILSPDVKSYVEEVTS